MSIDTLNSKLPLQELDALVVGTGFGGSFQLYRLRKAGFSVKAFEAGGGLGGVWYWNCYPGARVDSEFTDYQYSLEEIWRDWNWSERYPGRDELVAYFEHVDKKLDLSRDVVFNTRVTAAHFNTATNRWVVSTQNGITVYPRFLILSTGYASKPLFPDYKGLESFGGTVHHTALWPQGGVEWKGKRIGVIGTGASGVQIVQECGPEAAHLTVFQRTPNPTLPMVQYNLEEKTHKKLREELYPRMFRRREETFAGFHFDFLSKKFFDCSPDERYLVLDELWENGGFQTVFGGFVEIFLDRNASDEVYSFWKKKVSGRINDPEVRKKLVPDVPPHPFATKRPSLERQYYEVYNLPHVDLIDIGANPIAEITPKGVKTQDGVEHELDVLVLATGFDAVSGSIAQIDIQSTDGVLIRDKWAQGLSTYLGVMSAGFPNAFFLYGPQGPTAFCNGPTCAELQSDWIASCIEHMRANHFTRIEATKEAEDAYVKTVGEIFSTQLFRFAKSWYTGANVPGKHVESMNFTGGLPLYLRMCKESAENGYKGFKLTGQDEII